jgi:hypothetical protein
VAFDFVLKGRADVSRARISRSPSLHRLNKQEALQFVRERQEVFDGAGHTNPFACSAWILCFIEEIARDDWTFLVPTCSGEGDSLMLLYADGQRPSRYRAVANCYTSLYTPVIGSAPDRRAGLDALVGRLEERQYGCGSVQLAPLDGDSQDTVALEQAFARRGWYVKRYFSFGNWHLSCEGLSFEDYMAGRDSRLYNTWVRKARKFRGSGPGSGRLEIVTEPRDTEAAMDAYERVYARSWKEPEAQPGFIRGWARTCARNGWLRLGLAWVGDVPVAAQFWFTMNGRASIFKLAYDEEYAGLSAGTLLSAHLFRHALDQDRVAEIDYLTGDDHYKRGWMNSRRERVGLLACNPRTLDGFVLAAGELAREACRPLRRLAAGGAR